MPTARARLETAPSAGAPHPLARPRPALEPVLVVLLLAAAFIAVITGSAAIAPRTVLAILLNGLGLSAAGTWSEAAVSIVLELRVPRVVLAAVAGAGLAGAGVVFQGLLRNPLADPYIIGVSAGAAFGATLAISGGLAVGIAGLAVTPLAAFAGAVGATVVVYGLARRGDDAPIEDLLLAGVAVSAFLGAVVSWLQLASGESLQRVIYWLMGGFSGRGWPHVVMAAPFVIIGLCAAWLYGRDLNAFLLGDEAARSMGVDVAAARRVLLAAGAMMAAATVAAAGLIGFVGLIVPHLLRLLAGSDHRRLLPASALGGAVLLVVADTAARSALPASELPVGILTALLGAPFFLIVLARERRRFWT